MLIWFYEFGTSVKHLGLVDDGRECLVGIVDVILLPGDVYI